jgi:hypothetical protein
MADVDDEEGVPAAAGEEFRVHSAASKRAIGPAARPCARTERMK